MKKKLMMVAVLLGALTLGACVDDNESQSVTDVRNAKAEQLKSIAAMNNAQAEATLKLAEAEAKLKEQEAALKKAKADKAAAEAEIAALEAQMAADAYDAELAARLAQAEQAKIAAELEIQKSQGAIDKLAISLQTRLAELQKELLVAQKKLKDKEDAIADAELKKLNDLADNYAAALTAYTTTSKTLFTEKANLTALEAELKDWGQLKAAAIAAEDFKIEVAQKQIEALKKYANYYENVDELKLKLVDAEEAMKIAKDKKNALYKAWQAIDIRALKEAKDMPALFEAITENELLKLYNSPAVQQEVDFSDYIPFTYEEQNNFTIEIDGEEYVCYDSYITLEPKEVEDIRMLELEKNDQIAEINVAGKKKEVTDFKAAYDAKVAATAKAKAAFDAASTDEAKETAEAAYKTALGEEAGAKKNYDEAVAALAKAEEQVKELNDAYALVADSKAFDELSAAVKAYNDVLVTIYTDKQLAELAYREAAEVYAEANAEYTTLESMVNGRNSGNHEYPIINLYDLFVNRDLSDINGILNDNVSIWDAWSNYYIDEYIENVLRATWIRFYAYTPADSDMMGAVQISDAIKALETAIEDAKAEIEKLKDVTSQEQAIEYQKLKIAGLQAQVDALKVKADALKVRLDAAMKEYAPAE